jgi:hypothetical protein
MTTASFLFDTYAVAERTLCPTALSEAICTAVRLGRNAHEQERQAAFLVHLARQNGLPVATGLIDEDLADLLDACVQRADEAKDAFVTRLANTSNLSAIRVTLAELFQQEYGEASGAEELSTERRKAIRRLCKAAPPEVWSDIVQGDLKLEDADFLARPDFTILPIPAN